MADVKVTASDSVWAASWGGVLSDGQKADLARQFAEVRAEGFAAGVAQERERWAAIVQQETGYQAGVAAERERCLKLVDRASHEPGAQGYSGEPKHTDMRRLAAAIRAGEVRR